MPRRPVPPMTAARLEAATRAYLETRTTTRAHLRRLMMRRIDRAIAANGGERAPLVAALDAVLDGLERARVIDDAAWAASRARSLTRRGTSARGVRAKLAEKGVASAIVAEVQADSGADDELRAALVALRRRRAGPFAAERETVADRRALGALARGGFAYAVARRALDMDPDEALERVAQA